MSSAGPPSVARSASAYGVTCFLLSQACLALEGTAIRQVGPSLAAEHLVLLRGLGSAVLLGFLFARQGPQIYRTSQPGLQILRATLSFISLWMIFFGLARLPLAEATALTFTAPMWMTLLGAAFLGETPSLLQKGATFLGFCGALIVVGHLPAAWDTASLVLLAGVGLNAAAVVTTRAIGRVDAPATIFLWITCATLAGSTVSVPHFALPWQEWPALLAVSAAGTGAVWLTLLAVQRCNVSHLAPYGYSRLPLSIVFGLVIFSELPTTAALLGSAIILIAGLLPLANGVPFSHPSSRRKPARSPGLRAPAAGSALTIPASQDARRQTL
ncbi:DMT family transporter [Muricoccus pecuniae]|uniref:Drug/metabolite transporter (DMT)-like permease n=1 Tax=Muricoccus pecuniae TaxID=693023 RepID=A0A840Y8W8_9PROT|nr:DMT family transporter [Roseomonas pecuniae]MBB5696606.1 drug/metabolite transporter (DMT)-like permease [Roseomonas pecuniae]